MGSGFDGSGVGVEYAGIGVSGVGTTIVENDGEGLYGILEE